jgi:hypothetical protein
MQQNAASTAAAAAAPLLPPFSAQRPATAFQAYSSHTPAAVAAQARVTLARLQLAVAAAVWSAVYTDLRTAVTDSSSSAGSVLVLSHPMHNSLIHAVMEDSALQRHVRKVVQARVPSSSNNGSSGAVTSSSRALFMQALKANSARSEHAHSALQLLQQHSNSNCISSSESGLFNPVMQGDSVLVQRVLEHGHTASHIQEVRYCFTLQHTASHIQEVSYCFTLQLIIDFI